jgi:hypothetical protein
MKRKRIRERYLPAPAETSQARPGHQERKSEPAANSLVLLESKHRDTSRTARRAVLLALQLFFLLTVVYVLPFPSSASDGFVARGCRGGGDIFV